MKKLIYLLISFSIMSCTWNDTAHTIVTCPCLVTGISQSEDEDKVKVSSIEDRGYYFIFYTAPNTYEIGDTIK